MDSRIGRPGAGPASSAGAAQGSSLSLPLADTGVTELHNPCNKRGEVSGRYWEETGGHKAGCWHRHSPEQLEGALRADAPVPKFQRLEDWGKDCCWPHLPKAPAWEVPLCSECPIITDRPQVPLWCTVSVCWFLTLSALREGQISGAGWRCREGAEIGNGNRLFLKVLIYSAGKASFGKWTVKLCLF